MTIDDNEVGAAADGLACPVCAARAQLLDVVDFHKTCEEINGKVLPLSGTPIYYAICDACDFAFAPDMHRWSEADYREKIYNQDYPDVDPDYSGKRPMQNADGLTNMFSAAADQIKHLDYGGGDGLLSEELRRRGFDSRSYDPFYGSPAAETDETFNLITAFEVFEHVPNLTRLMTDISGFAHDESLVLFSTLLSDGDLVRGQRLNWWYAAPRNGHVSLYSKKSLEKLADAWGFRFVSLNRGVHVFFRRLPRWAAPLLR